MRITQRIDADLEKAGVGSLMDYDVLLALYSAPDRRLRLAELANETLISRSGLTRRADSLEQRGLLRRESVPSDRRGVFAVLTEEGVEEMRRIWVVYARGIAEYFGKHVTDAEALTLREIFARMVQEQKEL